MGWAWLDTFQSVTDTVSVSNWVCIPLETLRASPPTLNSYQPVPSESCPRPVIDTLVCWLNALYEHEDSQQP